MTLAVEEPLLACIEELVRILPRSLLYALCKMVAAPMGLEGEMKPRMIVPIGTLGASLFLGACATAGSPWTDTDVRTQKEAALVQKGRLCPVEIENATDGVLDVFYSAGPERARKLDRVDIGARVSVAVPCEARYVSVSALGSSARYSKRAALDLLNVTEVRLNPSDVKR